MPDLPLPHLRPLSWWANHYAAKAMQRGWYQYARHEVARMERCDSGLWRGIRQAVIDRLRAAEFRPHPSDLEEICP